MNFKIRILLLFFIISFSTAALAKQEFDTKLPVKGDTLGNIKLQADTFVPIYMAAAIKVGNSCDKYKVVNTKVTVQPHNIKTQNNKPISGQWSELWSIKACGKTVHVPVDYYINSTGVKYYIDQSKVR